MLVKLKGDALLDILIAAKNNSLDPVIKSASSFNDRKENIPKIALEDDMELLQIPVIFPL